MTGGIETKGKAGHADRRTGNDRRKVDIPRKGLPERRRSVESRQPDVVEIDMSTTEWGALQDAPQKQRQ